MIGDIEKAEVKKLGWWGCFFTLFKGFVATGILYIPGDFYNGGYVFSFIALLLAAILTFYCAHLLLEVNAKIGGSYSEIGQKTYGKCGKIMVDVTLIGSQVGFVCAYIYFIANAL